MSLRTRIKSRENCRRSGRRAAALAAVWESHTQKPSIFVAGSQVLRFEKQKEQYERHCQMNRPTDLHAMEMHLTENQFAQRGPYVIG